MWLLFTASTALGADIDAHGFSLAAFDADARDPLAVQRPGSFGANSGFFGAVFEFARAPIVAVAADGERLALIDDLYGLNLSAGYAPHERVRLDVTTLAYGYTGTGLDRGSRDGFGLGDTRTSAMVLLLDPAESGLGLGVVPHLDIPTGQFDAYLGRRRFAGGGRVAATLETGSLTATVDAGYQAEPSRSVSNLTNPDMFLYGVHLGLLLEDNLGVNVEAVGRLALGEAGGPVGGNSTLEAIGSLRYRGDSGAHFVAGGAMGVSRSAGTAEFRVFVGGGFGVTPSATDRDRDGLVDSEDACPEAAEVRNGFKDDDGCPDARPRVKVVVLRNAEDVQGAEVVLSGATERQFTTAEDPFVFEADPESTFKAIATLGECLRGENVGTVTDDELILEIELETVEYSRARVIVLGSTGDPVVGARVSFSSDDLSCVPATIARTNGEGTLEVAVGPGEHTVRVENGATVTESTFTANEGAILDVMVLVP